MCNLGSLVGTVQVDYQQVGMYIYVTLNIYISIIYVCIIMYVVVSDSIQIIVYTVMYFICATVLEVLYLKISVKDTS